MKNNKLYSYTTLANLISSLINSKGFLEVKQGLTIEQEVLERLHQQDNASSTSTIIHIVTNVVNDNEDTKLDDKVRDELHKTPLFTKFERFDNISKHHEWSLVKIDDLMEDFDAVHSEFLNLLHTQNLRRHAMENFLNETFLNNSSFMNALATRIFEAKEIVIQNILGTGSYKDITLRTWQQEVKDSMVKDDKFYNLLALAPRFGKTFTILEYAKTIAEKVDNLYLVPMSKQLSSNTSFTKDYKEGGYEYHGNFKIRESSLFLDTSIEHTEGIEKRIQALKEDLPENANLILVTDEADIASHTDKSIDVIVRILQEFNIVKQIAMSGTGIFKASKIFRGVPESDIHFNSKNYTELLEHQGESLVQRHFFNIQYNMEEIVQNVKDDLESQGKDLNNLTNKELKMLETFNISQSFAQPSTYKGLSEYLRVFIDDETTENQLNLNQSDVVMVFAPVKNKAQLNKFVKFFGEHNQDIETLTITGDYTNNAFAEDVTKTKIDTMKKLGDNRKLVIFSMNMGSRSYSVPQIRRTIILTDGFVTSSFYQKTARCLTYDYSKGGEQHGDIIRISFEKCDLFSELFLMENEQGFNDEETKTLISKQLTRNSFTDVYIEDGDLLEIIVRGENADAIISALDSLIKYTDTTKFIMSQLFDEGLEVNDALSELNNQKPSVTKSVTLTIPNAENGKPTTGTINVNPAKMTSKEERALEVYVDILRVLPYIGKTFFGTEGIDEIIKNDWEDAIIISKENFITNMKNKKFADTVDLIFRNADYGDENVESKVEDYLMM